MLRDCAIHIHELIFVQKEINSQLNPYVFLPMNGFLIVVSCPVMCVRTPLLEENGNTRGKQTMFYLKRVAKYRSKLSRNKSICDTLCM